MLSSLRRSLKVSCGRPIASPTNTSPETTCRRTEKFRELVLPVSLFHALARDISWGAGSPAVHDRLIFGQGEIAFLQQIIHLSRSQVGLLQYFRIGMRGLTDQI